MVDVTVFVPGILASRLAQPDGTLLWSENAFDSFSQLARMPNPLQWDPNIQVQPQGTLEEMDLFGVKHSFCSLLRREMHHRHSQSSSVYDEFGYDWRQDVLVSAKQLGQWLSNRYSFINNYQGLQERESEKRLRIVGHSMGCLVAGLAMMNGFIHPENVRRFICIGAPFLGAPAAFRALYDLGYLPGFTLVEKWVNKGKPSRARRDCLLGTIQSFPSAYQLLPHQGQNYVWIKNASLSNPLSGNIIPQDKRDAAIIVHSQLANLERFLKQNGVDYHFIYGVGAKMGAVYRILSVVGLYGQGPPLDTDGEFDASIETKLSGDATYEVSRRRRVTGDGTVPCPSAAFHQLSTPRRHQAAGVNHHEMCNDRGIVSKVMQLL